MKSAYASPVTGHRRPALRLAVRAGKILAAALALAAAMVAAACATTDPATAAGDCVSDELVVGSAGFPESETVAGIYTEVLRINGFKVRTRTDVGPREDYVPALRRCAISLIPDYTGNLLRYLDTDTTATAPAEVDRALLGVLGTELAIASPAPGQDADAVVVTRATAQRWNLKAIGDLTAHSAEVTLAAPAEFRNRPSGLPGLKKTYGLEIAPDNFVAVDDPEDAVRALVEGRVIAADIFTTSPAIAANDLVVLSDPNHHFAAQNVVPLFAGAKRSDKAVAVLDSVSAKLTTAELIALNEAVAGRDRTEPAVAARAWVAAQGLNAPLG